MAGASGDCPAPRQLTPSPLCLPPPASHRDLDSSFCRQGSRPHRVWASHRCPLRGHRVQPPWLCQQPPRHGSERGGWACPQAGGQDGETASEMKGRVRPRGRRARGPGEAACRTVPPPSGARREACPPSASLPLPRLPGCGFLPTPWTQSDGEDSGRAPVTVIVTKHGRGMCGRCPGGTHRGDASFS